MTDVQQNFKHTENAFNRHSIAFAIFAWAIFLFVLYFKVHFDLQGLPVELKVLLTIPLPLVGVLRYINEYHSKIEDEVLKKMVQVLHGFQAALPIIALLLLSLMPSPSKAKLDDVPVITRMLNDNSRPYRNNLRLDTIAGDYEAIIDSTDRYRRNLLLSIHKQMPKWAPADSKTVDSAVQDSLALICASLKRSVEMEAELNYIVDTKDTRGLDQMLRKYGIDDAVRAFIRRPGDFSLEDRYSVRNYLIQVAQDLEPALHIQVVWPPDLSSGIGNVENLKFIINKVII